MNWKTLALYGGAIMLLTAYDSRIAKVVAGGVILALLLQNAGVIAGWVGG